jgi:hypothetical protein
MKTLHTGGAIGSDIYFELLALKAGYNVKAYSFEGHTTDSSNRVILTQEELGEAGEKVAYAAQYLGRKVPLDNPYVYNLLRRNWFQVKNSEIMYAVADFDDVMWDGKFRWKDGGTKLQVRVPGGTGWAVAMALLENKIVCLFDQRVPRWYKCWQIKDKLVPYYELFAIPYAKDLPKFPECFAGIGTRNLNGNGEQAIKTLFNVNIHNRY